CARGGVGATNPGHFEFW
nr:immunoglobulin heavy chain junction region [Macaca mulatta]MOV38012.1 immunoglobulin heavy chain junction region [Macaca mulatta]MOV38500.1 immunoglobulin heavy chain junction region [Macaca mulatta]MOV44138.1 immunoglobulin heavy chain junction region [Macaca mulatta]MOV46362.1 immunoglobulin heavy chain junction region [Macaca mulatta]